MKRVLFFLLIIILIPGFYFFNKQQGEPDKTGSWSQINQSVNRPDDWKQIVTNTTFHLGEKKLLAIKGEHGTEEKYYQMGFGTYPSIDGSTVCVPMALEFARQHLGLSDEEAASFVSFETTPFAYENLIFKTMKSGYIGDTMLEEKATDIILVTEPSDQELKLARDNNVELYMEPVCLDAFVFITHKDNPVDSLTVEQIQKIYSGEITNWKAVGGSNKRIHAYQREENSGSQTTMEKQVMKGQKMVEPTTVTKVFGMGELIKTVAEYENSLSSIGYTFKYYIDTLYKNENIKVIKIDGVEPTPENMRNGTYPFTTHYFGVIRSGDKDGVGGRFLEWMLTDEGQQCIEQAGYCPILAQTGK